jgi:hypothetical protein
MFLIGGRDRWDDRFTAWDDDAPDVTIVNVDAPVPADAPPPVEPEPELPPSQEAALERAWQEERVRTLEDQVAQLTGQHAELRHAIEARAMHDHEHPMPAELRALHEHISDVEQEEAAPERRRWYHRRLWGNS